MAQKPVHPFYADVRKRLSTFKDQNLESSRLALCGFYYSQSSDAVKCFSCNFILENRDDPFTEHGKYSPECKRFFVVKPHFKRSEILKEPMCNEGRLQRFTCKICMDQDIQVLFQPCGHSTTCNKCALQLSKCPICRAHIDNVIKVYFQ